MNAQEIDFRVEKARRLHHSGHNCCQSVVLAYADLVQVDEQNLDKLAQPFGRGLSGIGEVCGCVSGMAIICGLTNNSHQMKIVAATFKNQNGDINCSRLLKQGKKPCTELVADAVRILGEQVF